ncbi:hypothetical protein ALC53_05636 [Atta colombica]|uniref:DNA-directed DNA polymerase n=1 Tax=Atta colombica TaxID=520822 RepID=A0A151I448_9HYME|nr:hypothetical protein ALC53_05636 [Atta colombica]
MSTSKTMSSSPKRNGEGVLFDEDIVDEEVKKEEEEERRRMMVTRKRSSTTFLFNFNNYIRDKRANKSVSTKNYELFNREIKMKKAVINMHLYTTRVLPGSSRSTSAQSNINRESSYPHYMTVLNFKDIQFPMTLSHGFQIKKFENFEDSINVYGIEKQKEMTIFLLRLVNLLYMQDPQNNNAEHFTIKDLSHLRVRNLAKKEHKKCDRSNAKLEIHAIDCEKTTVPLSYMYQHHWIFSLSYYVRCLYIQRFVLKFIISSDKLKNLAYKIKVFHNISGYDTHFIIKNVENYIIFLSAENFDLLIGKGIFPYEYVDCILLLTDVFENFKQLIWDAMLKHTHVKFEFLTDIDMVFIEHDIHRGLSQCSNRYAQTNNKYMPYESSKSSTYLMYFDINNLRSSDSPTGYVLEVDLEYHIFTTLTQIILSEKLHSTNERLYVIHYHNLYQCTYHGLNIAKIYRVKIYCTRNTKAMIAKPNFHSRSVFSENPVATEMRKLEVKFDKPIYVGMCIFDIFKYMAPLFRENCKIMYIDTDSLIYYIECDNIYDIMKHDINRFDTSNYAIDNAYCMRAYSDSDYELGLTDLETYHMISNVNSLINNKFYFDEDNKEIVIPERSYKIRDINEYLKHAILQSRSNNCEKENFAKRMKTIY